MIKTYIHILKLFPENTELAIRVILCQYILFTKKPKNKHLKNKCSFSFEIIQKHAKNLQISLEKAFEDFQWTIAVNDYLNRKELQGIGGCKLLTLQECLKNYLQSEEYQLLSQMVYNKNS